MTTAAPASDLDVLFPDRTLSVGGRELLVRELRFAEQVRYAAQLTALAEPFTAMDAQQLDSDDAVNRVYDLLVEHWSGLRELVAVSCGEPVDWIEQLPPADAEELLLTWWAVNQGFFVRRQWRRSLMRLRQAGRASSPNSSAPAMPPNDSAATPAAS